MAGASCHGFGRALEGLLAPSPADLRRCGAMLQHLEATKPALLHRTSSQSTMIARLLLPCFSTLAETERTSSGRAHQTVEHRRGRGRWEMEAPGRQAMAYGMSTGDESPGEGGGAQRRVGLMREGGRRGGVPASLTRAATGFFGCSGLFCGVRERERWFALTFCTSELLSISRQAR